MIEDKTTFSAELAIVKKVLDLDESKDDIINEVITLQYEAVKGYIGRDIVPSELMYIVTESAIARYNRRGFEGSEQFDRDILRTKFSADLLKPYKEHLDRFKNKPVVRFR